MGHVQVAKDICDMYEKGIEERDQAIAPRWDPSEKGEQNSILRLLNYCTVIMEHYHLRH